ncbi:YtpR family tRNA-binding protein [Agrilactobacillus fermenti]|uniref:YtpR family tRNA-binding protein n=1 Tax=Agrilactobacillus fermenti TaxID=2586909 RepID=UPI001E35EC9A|nr:DUF4479 and tRNA-binding domain-containing protein [Agrilactobacillus fermenti]MCD2256653.1 DUF4479 and tRNA-binding domain-containing protein [Agrilactobacillus fermenti]
MLIASYNPIGLGDVLVVILGPDGTAQKAKTNADVTRIVNQDTQEPIGFNFFNISKHIPDLKGAGQVFLNQVQIDVLNDMIVAAGWSDQLQQDETAKFVVGHVDEVSDHPDSDHLHITKVTVDQGVQLQIVCGAPNIAQGQNVVVAKIGAMMPDGSIIWPGKLRGIASDGMISSAKELGIPNAPKQRGILVLDTDAPVGRPFDFKAAQTMFI